MAPAATSIEAPMGQSSSGSKTDIKASVLHGPRDVRLETRNIQEPGSGELQIQIRSTGICGSDVSYYKKFANGDLCACAPLSLGHESSGIVAAIGPQVTGFTIGDRVALEVGIPCGQCGVCRKGRYNLCKRMRFRSSAKSVPHFQGTLQEKINHPAAWCYKLPSYISFDAAALLEPLSVAIHSVNRASPAPGSTALVMGAGTIGLLVAAMVRQAGCTTVTICDIDAGRVEYALKKGFATHGQVISKSPLHPSSSMSCVSSSGIESPPLSDGALTPVSGFSNTQLNLSSAKLIAADLLAVAQLADSTSDADADEDEGVDVTFECTGKESCMQTALYATRPGGKVIMVGMGTPIQTVPLSAAHLREVDILGVFRYSNTYPTGIRMLAAQAQAKQRQHLLQAESPIASAVLNATGLPDLDDMVTHRFRGLENAPSAFELAARTTDDKGRLVLKVVIEV